MTRACLPIRMRVLFVLAACATVGPSGCHTIDFYDRSLEQPVPLAMEPPREKSLMSLPAYRVAAPDVLQLEMLKQVPLPPYRAEAYDVLQIQVMGTLPEQPIYDFYLVEAEGTVNLGPSYGTVRVMGMTIEEITDSITRRLEQILARPEVSVRLARSAGTQPIAGEYMVAPDGTVNLRQYGLVHVAGKTVVETKATIEKHLSQYFDSPEVAVNVLAYNSKVYYIITEGAGLGDSIVRVPITGKETVLDAISTVGGLSQLSSKEIWVARPAPNSLGCEQILPIDYEAITRGAATETNYQLLPGDRVFVADDDVLVATNLIGTLTGPFERLLGISSLTTSTIRGLQTLGRGYNQQRRY
ncbi:MAG: polysaccharide biosynthesis/export family protein [Pirellulales bacterium]|nr:polysaccharide biosynthesis/export family protein [Pirellulales bacterium]